MKIVVEIDARMSIEEIESRMRLNSMIERARLVPKHNKMMLRMQRPYIEEITLPKNNKQV